MTTQTIIERENYSGEITFEERLVEWNKPDGSSISIDLNNVVVIGEYTTDSGPFADDWFLIFLLKTGEWQEVSVYADGFQELAIYLSKLFRIDFDNPILANSNGWRSYIRFPQNLEGKELFVLTPPKGYKPPTTVLQNMKVALGLGVYGKDWDIDLTEEVKAEVVKTKG